MTYSILGTPITFNIFWQALQSRSVHSTAAARTIKRRNVPSNSHRSKHSMDRLQKMSFENTVAVTIDMSIAVDNDERDSSEKEVVRDAFTHCKF